MNIFDGCLRCLERNLQQCDEYKCETIIQDEILIDIEKFLDVSKVLNKILKSEEILKFEIKFGTEIDRKIYWKKNFWDVARIDLMPKELTRHV